VNRNQIDIACATCTRVVSSLAFAGPAYEDGSLFGVRPRRCGLCRQAQRGIADDAW
jgi:hypothetical protein